MKPSEQKITEIDKLLEKKEALKKDLRHNLAEVDRLTATKDIMGMKGEEHNHNDLNKLRDSIREGKQIIKKQRHEISQLSLLKIANKTGTDFHYVRYQDRKKSKTDFIPIRDVRVSLGLAV